MEAKGKTYKELFLKFKNDVKLDYYVKGEHFEVDIKKGYLITRGHENNFIIFRNEKNPLFFSYDYGLNCWIEAVNQNELVDKKKLFKEKGDYVPKIKCSNGHTPTVYCVADGLYNEKGKMPYSCMFYCNKCNEKVYECSTMLKMSKKQVDMKLSCREEYEQAKEWEKKINKNLPKGAGKLKINDDYYKKKIEKEKKKKDKRVKTTFNDLYGQEAEYIARKKRRGCY